MKRYIQLHFLVLLLAATALLGRGISLSSLGVVTWRTALADPVPKERTRGSPTVILPRPSP